MRNKKAWLIVVVTALILVASVFGTLAYLTDKTEAVVNTFTLGKLLEDPENLVVKEHKAADENHDGVYTLDEQEVVKNEYTVLPGVDLPKDPFIKTTENLQLDAYVFVEVVDKTGTNLHAEVDSALWTELSKKTGPNGGKVYVMKDNGGIAKAGEQLKPVSILAGNKVTVDNASVTDAAAQFGGDIKFYGYLIQAGGFTDYNAAWAGLNP